jgi:pyrimidine operon attenuation protein/uracil phosphoribosyltransferase
MPESTVILDAMAIRRALARIAHEIAERNEVGAEVALIGIPVGGDHLALRLSKLLAEICINPSPSAFWT